MPKLYCHFPNCNKVCLSNENLEAHYRVHAGLLPFVCPIPGCNKSFSIMSNLKAHSQVHNPNRHFPCSFPNCGKSFKRQMNLSEHLLTKHSYNDGSRKAENLMRAKQSSSSPPLNSDHLPHNDRCLQPNYHHHHLLQPLDSTHSSPSCSDNDSEVESCDSKDDLITFPSFTVNHQASDRQPVSSPVSLTTSSPHSLSFILADPLEVEKCPLLKPTFLLPNFNNQKTRDANGFTSLKRPIPSTSPTVASFSEVQVAPFSSLLSDAAMVDQPCKRIRVTDLIN